ncbi:DUF4861 domain-containing protein [Prevotellaceae bacterium LKV-178-WT-2A]|uniref:DUF4861 domain-containing protein n=2 Tax=Hallella mizrahii TaxID=2606637 RepID=A0A7K0KFB7_9BACT|nr:DUF4861 domain-containing protein [Hallella mizrahii]
MTDMRFSPSNSFIGSMMLVGSLLFSLQAVGQDKTVTVTLQNPGYTILQQSPVEIPGMEGYRSARVTVDGKEVPSQMDDLDGDGGADHLFFLADIKAKGPSMATIALWRKTMPNTYAKRTFADILLRNSKVKAKNKHDIYLSEFASLRGTNPFPVIHQHGAVLESELTAYRFYCSPRQSVDIYGKRKRQLELHDTEFYPDSVQLAAGYGDDVLAVRDGVGVGALNGWDGKQPVGFTDCDSRRQRIVVNGPLRSIVEITDQNWKPTPEAEPRTLTTRYTMIAGHRDCKVDVRVSVPKGFNLTDQIRATPYFIGITHIKGQQSWTNGHGLLANWGTDYPVTGKDTLTHKKETVGLAISIPPANILQTVHTQYDDGYLVSIPGGHLVYYIAFCSDKEEQGYHSADQWFSALKAWKAKDAVSLRVRKAK